MRLAGVCAALVLLACIAAPVFSQELDPTDLEDRIDYAYFTQDAGNLRNLLRESRSTLAKGEATAQLAYVLGFAQYRLGLVLAPRDPPAAVTALSACTDDLDAAIDADGAFADALALQAACFAQLATLRTMTAVLNAPKSNARLDKARRLAPRNPRVVLVASLLQYDLPKTFGGDKGKALAGFKQAVELFEKVQRNEESAFPSWGQADALAALGRSLLESGDALGARNALERALLIAPDYAAAKLLLSRITAQ